MDFAVLSHINDYLLQAINVTKSMLVPIVPCYQSSTEFLPVCFVYYNHDSVDIAKDMKIIIF